MTSLKLHPGHYIKVVGRQYISNTEQILEANIALDESFWELIDTLLDAAYYRGVEDCKNSIQNHLFKIESNDTKDSLIKARNMEIIKI